MTNVLLESWETVNAGGLGRPNKWTSGGLSLSGTARHGNWGVQEVAGALGDTTAYLERVFAAEYAGAQHATFICGAAQLLQVRSDAVPDPNELPLYSFGGDAGAVTHVTLSFTPTGDLKVRRGDVAGTLLGTAAGAVVVGAAHWYFVELKVVLGAAGSVVVKVDGVEVLNLAGVNTKNGGTGAVFDSFRQYSTYNVNGVGNYSPNISDDLYLNNGAGARNNDFAGDVTILRLLPDGNGSNSDGAGSDGNSVNNYALVNEGDAGAGAALTSYVDLAVTDDTDTYAFEDVAIGATDIIKAVQLMARAEKADTGARSLTFVCLLGGVESTVTGRVLNAPTDSPSYLFHLGVFEVDPNGDPWTETNLNAAEFGVRAGA